jgi:GAF domain-containing protein
MGITDDPVRARSVEIMSTGNLTTTDFYKSPYGGLSFLSYERMNDIFNLSRQLVATNRLEVLLESIAQHATDILQVKFSRIITLEPEGNLVNQAIYANRTIPHKAQEKLRHLSSTVKEYRQAITGRGPVLLRRDDPSLSFWSLQELGFGIVDCLCMIPLRVDMDVLGLLVLGDSAKPGAEIFSDERLRLATLIADQAASAVYRVRLTNRLKESQLETVLALTKTLEARDLYTGGHSERMTELAERTAAKLNCTPDELEAIRWAANLHDIGKVGIPDEVLHKKSSLTADEWALVKNHPQKGAEIILMVSNLEHVAILVLAHHEKFDGSGYPYGLQKQRIPLGARIIAVVDSYSAMVDGRVYQAAKTHEEALEELRRCSGAHFDPVVVEAFISIFP